VIGLKILGMRGSFTFGLQKWVRWVRGEKICRDMQLGVDHRSEGGKMGIEGCKMVSEVLFEVLHFNVDGGMHVFIDGGNIDTNLSHFLLCLCEIRVQGIEASFQVLATGVGHDEEGKR
jgi:hypothetical protein